MTLNLPILVKSLKTKIFFLLFGGVATIVIYQMTNRMHFFEPQLLQFGWVDKQISFMPWTVWIYYSEYIIFFVAWFWLREDINRTRYFYSYMFILLFSSIVFVVYPITFPRHIYQDNLLPVDLSSQAMLFLWEKLDKPANCLPSLHVSSCYISAFCFLPESRKKFIFMFVWSTLVAFSTMSTKQHYFVDVWTAAILVVVAYYFFFVRANYYSFSGANVRNFAGAKW